MVLRLEGIEDIDLIGLSVGSLYIQVKTSDKDWGWSQFTKKNKLGQPIILRNFLETMSLDPEAQFLIVGNFGYRGILGNLVECCSNKDLVLTDDLRGQLLRACKDAGFPNIDINMFVSRLSFERISEEDILMRTLSSIAEYFNIETGNEELYLLTLIGHFINKAVKRETATKANLEEIRLGVQDLISKGNINEAIKYGIIEKLDFSEEIYTEDFYEGKNARPGHIAARVDVKRPFWIQSIAHSGIV